MASGSVETATTFVNIPYSNFTWNSNGKEFYAPFTPLPGKTLVGFTGRFTVNASAMFSATYRSDTGSVHVMGWIPSLSVPISSGYQFVCYAMYK
jgi:hypothetical protein